MKRFFAAALLLSAFTACDDDNDPGKKPVEPEETVRTAVNYKSSSEQVTEQAAAHEVIIELETVAEAAGTLEIELSGEAEYSSSFTTVPAASAGKISLAVQEGDAEVSFQIIPVNNTKLNGHKAAAFSIVNATGSVKLGESVSYILTFVDDELIDKLQMYEKNGSALTYNKNSYEYNEDGHVSKVHWQAKTGFGTSTGTDEYFYNEAGGITRISKFDGAIELKYTWDDGVIVKLERLQNGTVMAYNAYEYDEAGRVKNIDMFTKNMAGDFNSNTYDSYTYHEDGNVHKIVTYNFNSDDDAFIVAMTVTYDNYIEGHNPAPLEVLPNLRIQTKLPTYYSKEVASGLQEYTVAYEFSENGKQTRKTVTGFIADSGVTTYTYY